MTLKGQQNKRTDYLKKPNALKYSKSKEYLSNELLILVEDSFLSSFWQLGC